jgi:hypothetical protein
MRCTNREWARDGLALHRYRLQVDRQTKSSFEDKDAAEKAGKAIKKAHPVVQVTVYDAEGEGRVIIQAD